MIKEMLVVFLALFLVLPCGLASAVPAPGVGIALVSPSSGAVYFQQVPVAVSVSFGSSSMLEVYGKTYSFFVDGQPYPSSPDVGYFTLNNLNQGEHTVQAKCSVDWGYSVIGGPYHSDYDSGVISFFVNLGIGKPDVSILCSDNYVTNQVPLSIMTNTSRAQVSYSLDGQPKVNLPTQYALSFPVTLSNLTDGSHTIAAYATDFLGNTQTTQKNFTINAQNTTDTDNTSQTPPQIHPSPITNLAIIIGAAITTVILATAIVTVMHFRHKSGKTEKST